jgi:zinc protease
MEAAVALFERMMAEPTFPGRRARARARAPDPGAARGADQARDIVQRPSRQLLYRSHPYGRYATPESVVTISRDDLVAISIASAMRIARGGRDDRRDHARAGAGASPSG